MYILIHHIPADGAAPDGAALLGLGYNSDGDSQDSGRSAQPRAGQPGLATSAQGPGASPAAVAGNEANAEDNSNMSPTTAAGGWVNEEDNEKAIMPSFVKGQRYVMCMTPQWCQNPECAPVSVMLTLCQIAVLAPCVTSYLYAFMHDTLGGPRTDSVLWGGRGAESTLCI